MSHHNQRRKWKEKNWKYSNKRNNSKHYYKRSYNKYQQDEEEHYFTINKSSSNIIKEYKEFDNMLDMLNWVLYLRNCYCPITSYNVKTRSSSSLFILKEKESSSLYNPNIFETYIHNVLQDNSTHHLKYPFFQSIQYITLNNNIYTSVLYINYNMITDLKLFKDILIKYPMIIIEITNYNKEIRNSIKNLHITGQYYHLYYHKDHIDLLLFFS